MEGEENQIMVSISNAPTNHSSYIPKGGVPAYVLSHFSHVWLCASLWTVACQASLSMGFSRQEYWGGCCALLQGIFLTQGSNLCLLCLPALTDGFFTTSTTWETQGRGTKYYFSPINEGTEAQPEVDQSHTDVKRWSQDLNPGSLAHV